MAGVMSAREKRPAEAGGIAKRLGIGCAAAAAVLFVALLILVHWLLSPGRIPWAEGFVTEDCKGFLIVRIRPEDAGVKAFLTDREVQFQAQLREDPDKRPPWVYRQVFGETPAQMWARFMPVQMVWTMARKPGEEKLRGFCIFSTSRGKGMFVAFNRMLMKHAEGTESGGKHKGRNIILLKDPSQKAAAKDAKKPPPKDETAEKPPQPGAAVGMPKLPGSTMYPWVACIETSLLEANTLEDLKRGIDLAGDPAARFAGVGYLKTAYDGFAKDMDVIGAVSGESDLAQRAILNLMSFVTGEEAETLRGRVVLPEIRALSGCADIVEADRVRARLTISCADDKSAEAMRSALVGELSKDKDKREIEVAAHSTAGSVVTLELDVKDLDHLPRGGPEPKKQAEKKEEKDTREDADVDGHH